MNYDDVSDSLIVKFFHKNIPNPKSVKLDKNIMIIDLNNFKGKFSILLKY